MLGWLFWFWLDQKLTSEPDLFGVVDRHVKEPCEMIQLAFHISVVKIHVTFTPAPENVVFTAKHVGDFDRLFDLSSGVREHVDIARGRSSVHESWIGKKVCSSPQQVNAGSFLLFF